MPRWLAAAAILCAGAGVAPVSFARADGGAPDTASVLRIAIPGDPVGLDPILDLHGTGKLIAQQIGESLVGYAGDLRITPVLAESYAVSPDGRRYRFTLRRGARFHTGAPVRADDVAWVFREYYLNPERKWYCLAYYDGSGSTEARTSGGKVASVRAVNARTVEFVLEQPSALFLHRLADTSCSPMVFHRSSLEAEGKFGRLIGTGPFQFAEWRKGEHVRLTRFAGYVPGEGERDGYGGARVARVDALQFQIFPSRARAIEALRTGALDIVPEVSVDEYIAEDGRNGVRGLHRAETSWFDLLIQTSDPLLSDVRVRRAIAHAIDRPLLAASVTRGRVPANPSVVPLGTAARTAAHDYALPFDPARSRALLAEAGYQGQPIELVTSRDTYPMLYDGAVHLRSMLRAAGLNVVLSVVPWTEHLETHYRKGLFQLSFFLFGGRNTPTLAYGKFIGSKASLPRFQWDDAAAFALVQAAEQAGSESEERRIYQELHRRMIDDSPTIALFADERFDLVREAVRGYEPTIFLRAALWGVSLER
jgi:peptide/nickel transport system substrate-binding protein